MNKKNNHRRGKSTLFHPLYLAERKICGMPEKKVHYFIPYTWQKGRFVECLRKVLKLIELMKLQIT